MDEKMRDCYAVSVTKTGRNSETLLQGLQCLLRIWEMYVKRRNFNRINVLLFIAGAVLCGTGDVMQQG